MTRTMRRRSPVPIRNRTRMSRLSSLGHRHRSRGSRGQDVGHACRRTAAGPGLCRDRGDATLRRAEALVPIDDCVKRDAADMKEYFADVHPSLIEAMMWEGSLYQLPSTSTPPICTTTRRCWRKPALSHRHGLDQGGLSTTRQGHHQEGCQRPARRLWLCLDQPAVGQLDAVDLRQRQQPA